VVGSLVLVPHRVTVGRRIEAGLQAAALAGLCSLAYWYTSPVHVAWLPLPALMWAAMRLGTTWTALSGSFLSLNAAVAATQQRDTFGGSAHRFADLISGQGFAAVTVFMAMTMAATVAEREQAARALALSDPLTGVGNRRHLVEQAPRLLGPGRRPATLVGFFFCDLNGFKEINDVYGHEIGDVVLRVTAQRLSSAVRRTDVVARLGGDEFVVLCPDVYAPSEVERIGQRLATALADPIEAGSHRLDVTVSIGVAMQARPTTLNILMARADEEMHRNKERARSGSAVPPPRPEPDPAGGPAAGGAVPRDGDRRRDSRSTAGG
jgi:diguanylate cyclase (GGDEF)-like protein